MIRSELNDLIGRGLSGLIKLLRKNLYNAVVSERNALEESSKGWISHCVLLCLLVFMFFAVPPNYPHSYSADVLLIFIWVNSAKSLSTVSPVLFCSSS